MPALTLQQKINRIFEDQQAGRLVEAEALCRDVLTQSPQAAIYHLLGVLNHALGRSDEALKFIYRAIELNPNEATAHSNLGNVLLSAGHAEEAIRACERSIQLQPINPAGYINLGNALRSLGKVDEAESAYNSALSQDRTQVNALNNLGNIARERGQTSDAIALYQQAILLQPDQVDAHYNLGMALISIGRVEEAIAAYRDVVARRPTSHEAYNNLGAALQQQGNLDDAMNCYQRAMELNPSFAPAHCNLGTLLRDRGDLEGAIEQFRTAVTIDPQYHAASNHLGTALREVGSVDEALLVHGKLVARKPNDAEAHFSLALDLLVRGEFREGLLEYEWRNKLSGVESIANAAIPRWRGEPLNGARVLVYAEQGMGDFLQFVRYVPDITKRGGLVTLACYPEMKRLMQSLSGLDRVVEMDEPLPAVDFACPVCSLPLAFGTTLETIPAEVPYLHAEPELVVQWRSRLEPFSSELKAGIVWAGRPEHRNDRARSMKLKQLEAITNIAGAKFLSLQKGPAASDASKIQLIDWTSELTDFADTAALLVNLDLVITVDTAVAHLAGALGTPVWVLLPFAPDFRWLLNRDDSPWYPTMRLFRQPAPGKWEPVVAAVANALTGLLDSRR